MKKNKSFILLLLFSLFLILFGIYSFYYYISTETNKNYNLDKNINLLLTQNKIEIQNRPYFGYENAPITISIYYDIFSDNSNLLRILNNIKENHNNDKVKIIPKLYINENDIKLNSERFKINCIIYEKYMESSNLWVEIEKNLKTPANITYYNEKFNHFSFEECNYNFIYEDYTELKRFGLVGINPIIIIGIQGRDNQVLQGIPSYNRVNRIINEFYTRIGYAY
jgi:hypothetical protein